LSTSDARTGVLKCALIPGEDEVALAGLDDRLRDELQPVGELENMLMDRIIATYWRLRRVGRLEASMFAWESYTELVERNRKEARSYIKPESKEDLYEYLGTRSPSNVKDVEKLREHLRRADELAERQYAENTTLGRSFIRGAENANAFSKLTRYETALERSLYKALHELQRLQEARRREGSVSPPAALRCPRGRSLKTTLFRKKGMTPSDHSTSFITEGNTSRAVPTSDVNGLKRTNETIVALIASNYSVLEERQVGTTGGAGNIISGNGDGVGIRYNSVLNLNPAMGNRILSNSTYHYGALGIDLVRSNDAPGVTAIVSGDADAQQPPEITRNHLRQARVVLKVVSKRRRG
jgi:hypothetical protein